MNFVANKYCKDIYLFAFVLSLIISSIGETDIPVNNIPYFTIIKAIIYGMCFLIFLIKMFLIDKNSIVNYLLIIFVVLFSIIIGINSKIIYIPLFVSVIISSKNISYLSIVKCFFNTILSIFIFIVTLCLLKIIPNTQFYKVKGSGVRSSFGFNYPLAFSSFVLALCVAFCIIKYRHITWVDICLVTIVSIISYNLSFARMNLVCSIVLIIILVIWKSHKQILHRFPISLSWLALIIMTILTFYFDESFNVLSSFYNNFNKALSNRLYLSYYALKQYPITLLGNHIKENANNVDINGGRGNSLMYFYIDQSMVKILLEYGLIFFILIIAIYTYKMFKLHLENLDYLVLLFLVIVILGFSDDKFFELCYNPFLPILFADLSMFTNRNKLKRDVN